MGGGLGMCVGLVGELFWRIGIFELGYDILYERFGDGAVVFFHALAVRLMRGGFQTDCLTKS